MCKGSMDIYPGCRKTLAWHPLPVAPPKKKPPCCLHAASSRKQKPKHSRCFSRQTLVTVIIKCWWILTSSNPSELFLTSQSLAIKLIACFHFKCGHNSQDNSRFSYHKDWKFIRDSIEMDRKHEQKKKSLNENLMYRQSYSRVEYHLVVVSFTGKWLIKWAARDIRRQLQEKEEGEKDVYTFSRHLMMSRWSSSLWQFNGGRLLDKLMRTWAPWTQSSSMWINSTIAPFDRLTLSSPINLSLVK